ncbi:zinc ribbon domain-containing protein [Methanobacterium spitsbergense]|uniref:Zinc ribbon domain-containing protein n=1 Tax=Methanobacterium spitsbergense TaxID=2874285 RepID=A0A8T5US88_9EURY|nr:zinc ribbon domain-containing protein [Methanobacterium spitsbergense]MBZ2166638.1 zinc ribbon domain-containing protein [Methanobacterium spitsbergense]
MYCKECGAEIENGKFCSECGTSINSTKKKEGSEKKTTKKLKVWESVALLILLPLALYWILGILFAVAGLIIAVIYILYNDHQSKGG